jgi:ABC-type nitrate/sulfonate/bicarbonate transport system ATPase subunit
MSANISIDYITHTFRRQKSPTPKAIVLSILPGEQVALIGRSGCGKSTLLHMLADLMMPSEGCVRIHGHQVTRPSAKWNMMFQKPSLYPWMTVAQNAELGLVFEGRRDPKRIAWLFETRPSLPQAAIDGTLSSIGSAGSRDHSFQEPK